MKATYGCAMIARLCSMCNQALHGFQKAGRGRVAKARFNGANGQRTCLNAAHSDCPITPLPHCPIAPLPHCSIAPLLHCPIAITPPRMWQTANGRRTKEKGLMLIRRPVQSMQPVALAWGLYASRGLRHGNRQRVIGGALLNWQRAFLRSWQVALRVSDQAHGRCLRAACNACAWPEAGLVAAY